MAGCVGCRKDASSEMNIGSEELHERLIVSEELHALLIHWEELQVKLYLGFHWSLALRW